MALTVTVAGETNLHLVSPKMFSCCVGANGEPDHSLVIAGVHLKALDIRKGEDIPM